MEGDGAFELGRTIVKTVQARQYNIRPVDHEEDGAQATAKSTSSPLRTNYV